jgi:GT2 family glycosyltransferase
MRASDPEPQMAALTAAEALPRVSVIMVSYRTGPALAESIADVLAQSVPVELVLVDNGNPAEEIARLAALAEHESRVRLLTGHGNVGFARGCNLGARAASGTCLLVLNPDCRLPPGALAALHRHARGLARPWMIGARLLDADGGEARGARRGLLTPTTALVEALHLGSLFPRTRLERGAAPVGAALAPMPAISGACMFLPAEDFRAIGGFDEDYFLHVEDLDFCLRFRRAGGGIFFAPDVTVTHLGGTSAASTAFIERHKARGFQRYFRKNFAGRTPAPVLWALDAAVWARAWLKIGAAALRGGR